MSGFITWLERQNERDSKMRAVLRRSLAFDPGQHFPSFSYVEPFVKNEESSWRREVHYLVAGLWATHWREGRTGPPISLAKACAQHWREKNSASTERRFINLLDADSEQLPYRLRQMITLLKDQVIDFDALLKGLLAWNHERKFVQNAWARDFYRTLDPEIPDQPIDMETAE